MLQINRKARRLRYSRVPYARINEHTPLKLTASPNILPRGHRVVPITPSAVEPLDHVAEPFHPHPPPPITIRMTPTMGRGVFATRTIIAGEVLGEFHTIRLPPLEVTRHQTHALPPLNPGIPLIPAIFPEAAFTALNTSVAIDGVNAHDVFGHLVAELTLHPQPQRRTMRHSQRLAIQLIGENGLGMDGIDKVDGFIVF
jgi:hypothetical protein